ncbi:hypothetical protein AgCh_002440 [Apium graveolens]
MLMGVEKMRKQGRPQEDEEMDSTFDLRSQDFEIHDNGDCCSENFKDVDVVCVLPQCSTSSTADPLAMEMVSEHTLKNRPFSNSRIKSQDDISLDYDSGIDSVTTPSSVFEFQKAERGLQRAGLAPFSKPAPSKWDDAQKWIASPTSNRTKNGQPHGLQGGVGLRKNNQFGYGSRQTSMKVVVEVPDQTLISCEEADTKKMELSQGSRETGGPKLVPWEGDPYSSTNSYKNTIENCVKESAINLSQHAPSMSINSATAIIPPPSTARSVSMRDMGTEMTPIASQEPSRTGTPLRATTPIRSPTSSQPSSPSRASLSPHHPNSVSDCNRRELSVKEMQMKTRREIMLLGTQLGKMNIAAWASKEEEDNAASTSLETLGQEQAKSLIETRAAAWEEAEKAKCMARFKQEEIKIHAWENHEKAKTEAEMRKIEVEVERMSSQAHDKLMNKLAAARLKAEEKRAAAESKRNRQAAKTEKQADYIRRTGRIPSSFSCCGWWRS